MGGGHGFECVNVRWRLERDDEQPAAALCWRGAERLQLATAACFHVTKLHLGFGVESVEVRKVDVQIDAIVSLEYPCKPLSVHVRVV